MDFLQHNWAWLSGNPWGAITFAIICIGIGWSAARVLYSERLNILQLKGSRRTDDDLLSTFVYDASGRYGQNILANTTTDVALDERVSLRAEIPAKSTLHVEIYGPAPQHLRDNDGSWVYSVGHVMNWAAGAYNSNNGGRQSFDAEGGKADMQMQFKRAGAVKITAYEAGSQSPTWERELYVFENAAKSA